MRYATVLILIALAAGCTQGQRNDHYYCNDRESQEEYENCMEAGKEIRKSEEASLF